MTEITPAWVCVSVDVVKKLYCTVRTLSPNNFMCLCETSTRQKNNLQFETYWETAITGTKVCTCLSEFSRSVSRVFSSRAFSFIRSVLRDSALRSDSLSTFSSFSSCPTYTQSQTHFHPYLGNQSHALICQFIRYIPIKLTYAHK